MKLSWGYKIAIAYIAFVSGMGILVFKAGSQKFDLVTKDYYDQYYKLIHLKYVKSRFGEEQAVTRLTGHTYQRNGDFLQDPSQMLIRSILR